MKTATLQLTVMYDESITDGESIASAADLLLRNALSTPDILEEYGNPTFSEFDVLIDE
jgi:hypothetical protein